MIMVENGSIDKCETVIGLIDKYSDILRTDTHGHNYQLVGRVEGWRGAP